MAISQIDSTGLAAAGISQSNMGTGVAGTGPAFSVKSNANQSVTLSTWTKVAFQTEIYDTANCFDSATNYRFTPNVAGYYQFTAAINTNASVSMVIAFYKNGVEAARPINITAVSANGTYSVAMNGSTDYLEIYVYLGSTTTVNTGTGTYFQGSLVRAA